MSLKVYTASAGSGKTHALTREFLRLMLSTDDPRHFTTIQAVTFTKKATAEMKGRIVAELSTLVHRPQESLFTDELCKLLSISEHKLQGRARATLHSLLLDYSNFRVRTIDSFFQEVVRSFAYELGRSGALRVQIDSDQILRQAVLEVLARQDHEGSDKDIEAWLREMTTDSIEDGKSYSIDGELCKFAKQLESEAVKRLRSEKDFPNRAEVKALRTAAQKVITTCQQELLARADKALQALKASQIPIEKLSSNTTGVFGAVFAYKKTPSQFFDRQYNAWGMRSRLCAFLEASSDDEQLEKLIGKDKSKCPIREEMRPHLSIIRSALHAFREYNLQQLPLYTTALQICQYAGLYGILIDIDDVLQELKREGKLMLISDAPSLIQALIKDNNDAPFLYEKIGTRIEHHMIDEFQDTSRMQYENFVPLLRNAESQGKDCLIVGDAKQSIYRFRNSDSTLLTTQISDDFVESIEPTNLSDNWRSVPEIIDFNNALYPLLRAQISSHFDELWSKVAGFGFPEGQEEVKQQLDKELSELLKAYDDVQQSTPKLKAEKELGQVILHRYLPKEKDKNQDNPPTEAEPEGTDEDNEQIDSGALTQLPIVLVDLLKRGYRCSDIAILTRTKSTAAAIAEVLLSTTEKEIGGYSLPFISEEALHVDRAYSVRFIITVLSYLADTNITLRLAVLQEAYQQLLRLSQSHSTDLTEEDLQFLRDSGRQGLYEVVEIINARFGHLFPKSEGAYLVKLLDMLYSWEQEETADIANFLQYWQDKGAKQSISNATAEDAITLMTIHKSKGLGFPVVLLPDITWALDENLKGNKENILWCPIPDIDEVKSLRVAGVTSVPLKYASILQMSYFSKPYFKEKLKNMLDSLNLLYVATTRPKQELHIWIKEEKPVEKQEEEKEEGKDKGKKKGKQPQKKEKTISSIEDLFLATTETGKVLCDTLPAIQTTKEELIGDSASAPRNATKATEEEETIPLTVEGLYSYPVDKRLAILREGLEHFSEDSQRAYGRTLHLILSEIKTAGDVETAIREAEHQGYIKAKDLEGLRLRLNAVMTHPQTAHWFDGTGEVFNERAIIGGQLKTSRRPDRVVFYPDDGHIEVIDYKSGEERTAHHRQVREYMSLLRQMGYTKITGYLCYFRDEGPLLRSVTA